MCKTADKQAWKSFAVKQQDANDLLTGLIIHQPDLGAMGEVLVHLLLSTTSVQASGTRVRCRVDNRRRLH